MDNKKRNLWDFMCEHPFISTIIISSICETVVALVRPRKANITISKPDLDNMKDCGSTEEEPEATKEEN